MNLGIETETLEFKRSTGELKEAMTALLLNSGSEGNRWENLISNKTVEDADEELLKKYIAHAQDVGRIAITYTDRKNVLNQLELIEGVNNIRKS